MFLNYYLSEQSDFISHLYSESKDNNTLKLFKDLRRHASSTGFDESTFRAAILATTDHEKYIEALRWVRSGNSKGYEMIKQYALADHVVFIPEVIAHLSSEQLTP